ncbi:MAG: diadenylate cyclase CdaA [Polyangiaceae bacterium]|nr:diadenylate cyclase CdaA [Polyangiaceae bacterium]
MLEGLLHLFARRSLALVLGDVADILLVSYVIYRALLVLRGTRAMQMGLGLGVLFLVNYVSKWAGLISLYTLLSALLSPIVLIIVVLFQNDIRRGLMRVGARAFFSGLSRQQESKAIDEVVAAATELARHRIGALIAFEQDANLDEFVVGQGTPIDSAVQRELLVSLFIPESLNKLHDGAVIIRNLRLAKAGVFFPMPDTKVLHKSLGSRHRAALGITEETDAVVVVVSEERGSISFCFNGNIVTNLDGASLRQALLGLFGQRPRKRSKTAVRRPGVVTQTGTGSFRVVTGPAAPGEGRPSREMTPVPPPPLAGAETTGSVLLAPPARPPLEREPSRHNARPMSPAKPLETPKPGTPVEAPPRPREE